MKSTHNVLWAYAKSAAVTLAMVAGTAALMTKCSGAALLFKEYSQTQRDAALISPPGHVTPQAMASNLLHYECKTNSVNTLNATTTGGGATGGVLRPEAGQLDRNLAHPLRPAPCKT